MRKVLVLATLALCGPVTSAASQSTWGATELTEYRLTEPVFKQFAQASRLIGAATRDDPAFIRAPLFTKEIALSGEVQEMAIALETRLTHEPVLSAALREAGMTAHDYTKVALTLFAARLAHGFVESGVLRRVPDGAATDNVKFVGAHLDEIVKVLQEMNVDLSTH